MYLFDKSTRVKVLPEWYKARAEARFPAVQNQGHLIKIGRSGKGEGNGCQNHYQEKSFKGKRD
jgi:hypothetical protein